MSQWGVNERVECELAHVLSTVSAFISFRKEHDSAGRSKGRKLY